MKNLATAMRIENKRGGEILFAALGSERFLEEVSTR